MGAIQGGVDVLGPRGWMARQMVSATAGREAARQEQQLEKKLAPITSAAGWGMVEDRDWNEVAPLPRGGQGKQGYKGGVSRGGRVRGTSKDSGQGQRGEYCLLQHKEHSTAKRKLRENETLGQGGCYSIHPEQQKNRNKKAKREHLAPETAAPPGQPDLQNPVQNTVNQNAEDLPAKICPAVDFGKDQQRVSWMDDHKVKVQSGVARRARNTDERSESPKSYDMLNTEVQRKARNMDKRLESPKSYDVLHPKSRYNEISPGDEQIPLYEWSEGKNASDDGTATTASWSDDEDDDEEEENWQWMQDVCSGLDPPKLWSGERVSGVNKNQLRRQNKQGRIRKQEQQEETSFWTKHQGNFKLPAKQADNPKSWKGGMCPQNLALHHPAAEKLLQYATGGCPCNTGKPWTKEEIWAAVERGPHVSALEPDAIEQLEGEIPEKVKAGQCKVVLWDDIKDNIPPQLKISPLAMIPHKSRKYRAILDLSFRIRLKCGREVASVNEGTTLEAPAGAIDQMGHSLQRIIHAFAEADQDAKIFMAKFDIKDGFWRLDCEKGEEWNFAYVLPQREGEPVRLVVPTSLQMGWVESPPYFCAASETGRDVAAQYAEMEVGTLPDHKFVEYAMGGA